MPGSQNLNIGPGLDRLMFRASGAYLVSLARIVVRNIDADLLTALAFLAIARANTAGLLETGEVTHPHMGLPGLPSDALRQPISVYALGRELGLPYETARRHVRKLIDSGRVARLARGLIVPSQILVGGVAPKAMREAWRASIDFVDTLGRFGVVAPGCPQPRDERNARQIVRLAIDYFLEAVQAMARQMKTDVLSVMVLRTIAVANVEHLARSPEAALAFGALEAIPPDNQRRPVSVYAVSRHLGLPYETVRRTILKLAGQGLVERQGATGVLVPTRVVASPQMIAGVAEQNALTRDHLARLARFGLVAEEAAAPSALPKPFIRLERGRRRARI